jgi:hypothetical protein
LVRGKSARTLPGHGDRRGRPTLDKGLAKSPAKTRRLRGVSRARTGLAQGVL